MINNTDTTVAILREINNKVGQGGVTSFGGKTGAITLGTGLSMNDQELEVTVQGGVTSFGGATGAILIGDNLSMDGNTLKAAVASAVETVSIHVSTYDGLGTVTGLAVGITDNNTSIVYSKTLDSSGNCSLDITKGHSYTISVASLAGYRNIPDQSFTANIDARSVNLVFELLATTDEVITVHMTIYNSSGTDITSTDTGTIGTTVTCLITGGNALTALIGSDHSCQFTVPYGSAYTIHAPKITNYSRKYLVDWSYTASVPYRTVAMHYTEGVASGIIGIKANGSQYTYDDISDFTEAEKAEILYIGVNTSRLSSAGAAFMYEIPKVTASKSWAGSDVEFDTSLLPYKTSHATAVLDLDGYTNTTNIIAIGDSLTVSTDAADWCRARSITVGGVTKLGFLPAFGLIYALSENISEINAMHILLGQSTPGFTSGVWWTSTQSSATTAVNLFNGSFDTYYKTTSDTTLACFAL